ncbi:MAG: hypothetical protein ACFB2X_24510 [Rivularia sp. (in: cyanobacteria)]
MNNGSISDFIDNIAELMTVRRLPCKLLWTFYAQQQVENIKVINHALKKVLVLMIE